MFLRILASFGILRPEGRMTTTEDEDDDDASEGVFDTVMYYGLMSVIGIGSVCLMAKDGIGRLFSRRKPALPEAAHAATYDEPETFVRPHVRTRRRARPIAFFEA